MEQPALWVILAYSDLTNVVRLFCHSCNGFGMSEGCRILLNQISELLNNCCYIAGESLQVDSVGLLERLYIYVAQVIPLLKHNLVDDESIPGLRLRCPQD